MRIRRLSFVAILAGALTLAGTTCRSAGGPPDRPEPVPGRLIVELESPNPDDGAVVVYVRGQGVRTVTAARPEYLIYTRNGDAVWRVALIGDLESGPILFLDVEDVGVAFGGTVVEVADRANVARSPAQYFVRIRPTSGGV